MTQVICDANFDKSFYLFAEHFYEVLDCSNDTSNFVCITEVRDAIIWEIMRGRILVYSTSFHQDNQIGIKYKQSVESINISAEISNVSSTHITSTLMVTGNFSLYSILCNNVLKVFNALSPEGMKIIWLKFLFFFLYCSYLLNIVSLY